MLLPLKPAMISLCLKLINIISILRKMRLNYSLVLLSLIFAALSPTITAADCNSFPKIFGGSTHDSNLYQFDVFKDYLAMAGDTSDSSLTGITG
jgi:hypothetical protein